MLNGSGSRSLGHKSELRFLFFLGEAQLGPIFFLPASVILFDRLVPGRIDDLLYVSLSHYVHINDYMACMQYAYRYICII